MKDILMYVISEFYSKPTFFTLITISVLLVLVIIWQFYVNAKFKFTVLENQRKQDEKYDCIIKMVTDNSFPTKEFTDAIIELNSNLKDFNDRVK